MKAMKAKAAMKAMKAPSKAGATAKVKAKAAATIKKITTVATKATAKVTAKAKVKAVAKAAATTTAASAPKLGKFDMETWMKEHASRAEAQGEKTRRYFTSRVHHRIQKAARDASMPAAAAQKLRELVCARAGQLWDLVHPKKVG